MPTKESEDSRVPRPGSVAAVSAFVTVLSLATGATDAIAFTKLGNIFASVMTGNMVLLGVSAGRRDPTLAVHAGVSLGAYLVGTALGARLCRGGLPMRRWWGRGRAVVCLELVLFVGVTAGWEVSSGRPSGSLQLVLLVLAVMAMAVQAALVRSLPEETPSTTYMTSTLTTTIASFVLGSSFREQQLRLKALTGLVLGAGLATVLVEEVPEATPFLVLSVLVAALAVTSTHSRTHSRFSKARVGTRWP